jgi:integrase/recombinase XerC/integrase/recombinase XerD
VVSARVELPDGHPLARPVTEFLGDLVNGGRSPHTVRGYRGDLAGFAAAHAGGVGEITVAVLRVWLASLGGLSPATRARKQAAVAAFLGWCVRHELIEADPMGRLERVSVPPRAPRGVDPAVLARVLAGIPKARLRDRVLFGLIAATGLRAGEALGAYVEDLVLARDDEHLTVTGKGRRVRTVLLDDPALLVLLRRYLRATGYRRGPLFRAEKNNIGGPLRYASAQELWSKYCRAAGVQVCLHQLRHSHATELINGGVPVETVRKRLGHRNIAATLLYAEKSDRAADDDIRAWQRRRTRRAPTLAPRGGPAADADGGGAPAGSGSGPSCPECGRAAVTASEMVRLAADLGTTWLVGEAGGRGRLEVRRYCHGCAPSGPVADISCAHCGDGPLLGGPLAAGDGPLPEVVAAWLVARGWGVDPVLSCPVCPPGVEAGGW